MPREELIEAIVESQFSRRILTARKRKLHALMRGSADPHITGNRRQQRIQHLLKKIQQGNFEYRRSTGTRHITGIHGGFYDNL